MWCRLDTSVPPAFVHVAMQADVGVAVLITSTADGVCGLSVSGIFCFPPFSFLSKELLV